MEERNMEDNMVLAEQLKQAWKELAVAVKKDKQLKIEAFDDVFTQTYTLLSKFSSKKVLDKSFVELIAEAYLFANIKDDTLDITCLAAFILTERMLSYCAFRSNPTPMDKVTIYIFENRQEVQLYFADVGESIAKLTNVIEKVYWKSI